LPYLFLSKFFRIFIRDHWAVIFDNQKNGENYTEIRFSTNQGRWDWGYRSDHQEKELKEGQKEIEELTK
jgi:hypothetical protein